MNRFNNWMSYSFRDGDRFKSHPADPMTLHFRPTPYDRSMSYRDALYYNARMVADNFAGPFDVFLSGGIDSEVIVRVNHDLGIKQKLYTIRLEDGLNARDVTSAERIAEQLGQKLHIIDFNAQRWLEQQGEQYYKRTYISHVANLIRLGWLDFVDNTCIMGYSEPYWVRVLGSDHTTKSLWVYDWDDAEFGIEIYMQKFRIRGVPNWYAYTPNILFSFHEEDVIKKLINDEIPGKQSSWSSRATIYKKIWTNMSNNQKLVGFEGNSSAGTFPKFMTDFVDNVMFDCINVRFQYTVEQVEQLLQ